MLMLCFYVPETHLEVVKTAVFTAGAGKIGNYEHCAWQVAGTGQFTPLPGSKPFIGAVSSIEKVCEFRVEMVCQEEFITQVKSALLEAHPYEEPAWHVVRCVDV